MSVRRRLLLRSLIERVGGRLQPCWLLRDASAADVLLYDPAEMPAPLPERALALPLLLADEAADDDALCLRFPPAPSELARFLERAAKVLASQPQPVDGGPALPELGEAVLALTRGRREAIGLRAGEQRLALTATGGHLRLHVEDRGGSGVAMTAPEVARFELLPQAPARKPGSMRAGARFAWALGRALASRQHGLVEATVPLTLRRWPRPPEAILATAVATRVGMRMAPGRASLRALQQCGHFAAEDVGTVVNAGALLGFVAPGAPAIAHGRLRPGRDVTPGLCHASCGGRWADKRAGERDPGAIIKGNADSL